MAEESKEQWFPHWRPRLRVWLDELLEFGFIFASLIVFHSVFRLGRTAFDLGADLMNFMEQTDHYAVKAIWILFLLSLVRKAATATFSPAMPTSPATDAPANVPTKKHNGRRRRSQ